MYAPFFLRVLFFGSTKFMSHFFQSTENKALIIVSECFLHFVVEYLNFLGVNVKVKKMISTPEKTEAHESMKAKASLPSMTMRALFGPHFSISEENLEKAADPSLADTHSFLVSLFGAHISEHDIDAVPRIEVEFNTNEAAVQLAEVEKLFGKPGAQTLRKEPLDLFTLLHSTLPDYANLPKCSDSWLVEMPKIQPNRQTAHADPQPIIKNCQFHPSTSRMLFTPSNIMRWGYHPGTNSFVSNTRLIRWSDGLLTLHIGEDVYSVSDWRSTAEVHLLGNETIIHKHGLLLPSFTACGQNVKRHLVIDSTEAASIQNAVAEENAMNLMENKRHRLGYATDVIPSINWEQVSKGNSVLEEFVAKEYARREKEIQRRYKMGQPTSLAEQFEWEKELSEMIKAVVHGTLDVSDIMASGTQKELTEKRRQPSRRKFDRNLSLDGDFTVDPLADADNDDNDRSDHSSASDDYEEMMKNMQQKRDREVSEERREKRVKFDGLSVSLSVEKVKKELLALKENLPFDSEVYCSVDGTIEMLDCSLSFSLVEKELEMIIKVVKNEYSYVDISGLANAFNQVTTL